MKKTLPLRLRIQSLLLVIVFIMSNHLCLPAFAANPVVPNALGVHKIIPENLSAVHLPEEIGKVQEVYSVPSTAYTSPVVILIQDAHAIPEAQRNIQKIIEHFQKGYGVGLVALEGVSSQLDSQIFKSFPDKELLKKTFEEYFEKGELTGSTAAAIFNESKSDYEGIEDWGLYEEGLSLYLEAMGKEKELLEAYRVQRTELREKKEKIYSERLLAIDQALEGFKENHGNLMEVLKKLAGVKSPEKGTEIALLLEEGMREGTRNESSVREVNRILEAVKPYVQNQEQRTFNEKLQEFQTSQMSLEDFALFLKGLAEKNDVSIPLSRQLNDLIENQKKIRRLEGTAVFLDFEKYAKSVKETLFRNDEEKKLDEESRQLELLKKLAKLELSREEWNEIKASTEYRVASSEWMNQWGSEIRFYENAKKRDAAFFKNLMRLTKQKLVTRDSSLATLLVAGGFHTEGLIKRFKEQGISYVLVTPAMTNVPEQTNYRQHMRGEVSWKKYFEVENGKINLYKAFVRGTRDRLLSAQVNKNTSSQGIKPCGLVPCDPVLLKEWRDQIIRDLAETEQISKAQQYTQFIDEVASHEPQAMSNELRDKWLANIDRFVERLRQLKTTRTLTEQNVLKLLQPSMILSAVAGNADLGVMSEIKAGLLVSAAYTSRIPRSEVRAYEKVWKLFPEDKNGQLREALVSELLFAVRKIAQAAELNPELTELRDLTHALAKRIQSENIDFSKPNPQAQALLDEFNPTLLQRKEFMVFVSHPRSRFVADFARAARSEVRAGRRFEKEDEPKKEIFTALQVIAAIQAAVRRPGISLRPEDITKEKPKKSPIEKYLERAYLAVVAGEVPSLRDWRAALIKAGQNADEILGKIPQPKPAKPSAVLTKPKEKAAKSGKDSPRYWNRATVIPIVQRAKKAGLDIRNTEAEKQKKRTDLKPDQEELAQELYLAHRAITVRKHPDFPGGWADVLIAAGYPKEAKFKGVQVARETYWDSDDKVLDAIREVGAIDVTLLAPGKLTKSKHWDFLKEKLGEELFVRIKGAHKAVVDPKKLPLEKFSDWRSAITAAGFSVEEAYRRSELRPEARSLQSLTKKVRGRSPRSEARNARFERSTLDTSSRAEARSDTQRGSGLEMRSPLSSEWLSQYLRVVKDYDIRSMGGWSMPYWLPDYWNEKIALAEAKNDLEGAAILRDLLRWNVSHLASGTTLVNKRTGKATLLLGMRGVGKSTLALKMVEDANSEWSLGMDDFALIFFVGNRLIVGWIPRENEKDRPDHLLLWDTDEKKNKGKQIPNAHQFFEVANVVLLTHHFNSSDSADKLWQKAAESPVGLWFLKMGAPYSENYRKLPISAVDPGFKSAIEEINAAHAKSLQRSEVRDQEFKDGLELNRFDLPAWIKGFEPLNPREARLFYAMVSGDIEAFFESPRKEVITQQEINLFLKRLQPVFNSYQALRSFFSDYRQKGLIDSWKKLPEDKKENLRRQNEFQNQITAFYTLTNKFLYAAGFEPLVDLDRLSRKSGDDRYFYQIPQDEIFRIYVGAQGFYSEKAVILSIDGSKVRTIDSYGNEKIQFEQNFRNNSVVSLVVSRDGQMGHEIIHKALNQPEIILTHRGDNIRLEDHTSRYGIFVARILKQKKSRSEVRSDLKERYEKMYQDFMAVEEKKDLRGTASIFDPKKLEAMPSNYEQDEQGSLRQDAQGQPIPRASEVYPLYIPIHMDEKVSLYLQDAVKEILQALPEGTAHYAAPPSTYHISTFMAQDLRPEDVTGPQAKQLVLTDEERIRLTDMMREEFKAIPNYSIRLSGIRFSPQDGGVIAVFEDNGETDQIRARLTKQAHEITAKVDETKYPKNFIHVTLFRILKDIDSSTLGKLKALAQKYHDLTPLQLDYEVSEMEFAHETGWMHSKIESGSKISFGLAPRSGRDARDRDTPLGHDGLRSEVRMTRAEAFRSKENFDVYMDQRIMDLVQGREKELAGYLQAWHKANSRDQKQEIEKDKIQPFLDRVNARAFGVKPEQVQIVSQIPQLDSKLITPEMKKQSFLDVINGKIISEFLFASDARHFDRKWMYFLDIPKLAREANLSLPQGVNPRIHVPLGVRQLLAYRIRIEEEAKKLNLNPKEALAGIQMLIHLHPENAEAVLKDILEHDFYGFSSSKVYFLIQDSFQGRMPGGIIKWKILKAKQSPFSTAGHGYAVFQMTRPHNVFTVTQDGGAQALDTSFFEHAEKEGAEMIIGHRDNDLTQITGDVLDLERISFMKDLMSQGIHFVTEAVKNPNRQQGGNRVRAKGIIPGFSPEFLIEAIVSQTPEWGYFFHDQSVPYNTFRNGYKIKPVHEALIHSGLPAWLTFREGFLYLSTVAGDLTQNSHLRNQGYMKPEETIHDIKTMGNLPEALEFIVMQDRNPRFMDLALQYKFERLEIWNTDPVYDLIGQLKEQDWHVREEAARRLGTVGSSAREAIPHLLYLLYEENEPQQQVRQAGIESLTEIARSANQHEMSEIAVQLTQALIHDKTDASEDAMRGLVKIGQPAVAVLTDALRDNESPEKRLILIHTLGRIGPQAAGAAIQLAALLNEEQPVDVSQEAKKALINIGKEAAPYLLSILKDKGKDDTTRQTVSDILIKTGYSSRLGLNISKIINDLRKDASPAFSIFAQHVLAKAGEEDPSGLIQIMKDPRALPHVRAVTARALGEVGAALIQAPAIQQQIIRNLIELLTPPIEHVIYEASAQALGKVGAPALNDLRNLLNHDNVLIREAAATALGVMGPQAQTALPDLFAALNHVGNTYGTQRMFGKTFAKIGPAAIPGLLESSRSESQEIRDISAEALGEIIRSSKVEAEIFNRVLSQLLISYGDDQAQVFSSAYHAFLRIGSPVIPRLIERMKNGNPVEREGAVRILGSMADQAGTSSGEIVLEMVEIFNQSSAVELRAAVLNSLARYVAKSDLQEIITRVVTPLLILASQDQTLSIRRTAAQTIAHVRNPAPELIAAAIDALADQEVRGAYEKTLTALRIFSFEAVVDAASNDQRESVRASARSILNTINIYEPGREEPPSQNRSEVRSNADALGLQSNFRTGRSEVRVSLALALYPQTSVEISAKDAREIAVYLVRVPLEEVKESLRQTVERYTAILDAAEFQRKTQALIETLPGNSKQTLVIGLVLPEQERGWENQAFLERFFSLLKRSSWISQVIIAKGNKAIDKFRQVLLNAEKKSALGNIQIRTADFSRKLWDEDDRIVPVIFTHGAEQKQIHAMFTAITDDQKEALDSETETYVDIVKIVAAAHFADIVNTKAELLKKDPAKIKGELLKRMRISHEFEEMIALTQGKNGQWGIRVRSAMAALHLRHQTDLKLQQAA